jgi:UDP:flavonoid glycosyltransferase YjiC (YdhE family)
LAAGVPLVVMPHSRDQADNAARLVARHAGVKVSRKAKPKAIASAIDLVLSDPSFAAGARRLGDSIREDASAGRLLSELETIGIAVHA